MEALILWKEMINLVKLVVDGELVMCASHV